MLSLRCDFELQQKEIELISITLAPASTQQLRSSAGMEIAGPWTLQISPSNEYGPYSEKGGLGAVRYLDRYIDICAGPQLFRSLWANIAAGRVPEGVDLWISGLQAWSSETVTFPEAPAKGGPSFCAVSRMEVHTTVDAASSVTPAPREDLSNISRNVAAVRLALYIAIAVLIVSAVIG